MRKKITFETYTRFSSVGLRGKSSRSSFKIENNM